MTADETRRLHFALTLLHDDLRSINDRTRRQVAAAIWPTGSVQYLVAPPIGELKAPVPALEPYAVTF
jgi:hypothetical protein